MHHPIIYNIAKNASHNQTNIKKITNPLNLKTKPRQLSDWESQI